MKDLLSVEDLAISFNVHGGKVDAVRGVSFRVPVGGSVALVGESGSGKSVISQAIMGILPPAAHHPQRRDPVQRSGGQGRGPSTSPRCPQDAAICAPSAAAASPSSSRSR